MNKIKVGYLILVAIILLIAGAVIGWLNSLAFVAALIEDHCLGPVTALLLADGGYAPLNPPDWIERWRPQAVLLSVAAGDAQVLQAVEGRTLLRTDRNGWIELSMDVRGCGSRWRGGRRDMQELQTQGDVSPTHPTNWPLDV